MERQDTDVDVVQEAQVETILASRPVTERQIVTGYGVVRVIAAESEKQRLVVQVGLDRLFSLPAEDGDPVYSEAKRLGVLASVPRWEAYAQIMGDPYVSGAIHPKASIVREANEVTSGVLNFALLNSMTKRLVRDFKGQPK